MSADQWQRNANALWAHVFVDELIRCGVEAVCISPGSRSTPLVVEFGGRHEIDDLSVIDERSAGFVALGRAKATGRPTALVCTSGTAAANLYPAVCEASAAGVPLVVLTADRPRRLQGVGASQAMDQLKLYGDHVRAFFEVGQPEATAAKLRYLRGLACRSVATSMGSSPGPVHLNFSFRKPLAPVAVDPGEADSVDPALFDEAPVAVGGRDGDDPWLRIDAGDRGVSPTVVKRLRDRLVDADRPLIFVGAHEDSDPWRSQLLELADTHRIPVIAEATSGLRYTGKPSEAVVTAGDLLVESPLYDECGPPDLLLRFGRAPISWPMRRWFPDLRRAEHIVVSPGREPADPDHLASWQIRGDESRLLDALRTCLDGDRRRDNADWFGAHRRAEQQVRRQISQRLDDESSLSAPLTWHVLGHALQPGATLFVSSSMPIRDVETFLAPPTGPVDILANRGLNGIDGILSTGFGVATTPGDDPTVIVVGDVAFRHDIATLLSAAELDVDATVVVIDNGGGAIFDYLPLADLADKTGPFGETIDAVYERHFRTPRRLPVDNGRFGPVTFEIPETPRQLRDRLVESQKCSGVQVLVVETDAADDQKLRQTIRRVASGQPTGGER